MMDKSIILSLNGLAKHFGGLKVIEDISLEVAVGEKIGLIGPNGAGKTTLFNMIAGDLEPSGGAFPILVKKLIGCQIINEHRLELSEPSKKIILCWD